MDFITYFVLNKIKAKKKVQWIHFDITKIGFNKVFAEKNYRELNEEYDLAVAYAGPMDLIKLEAIILKNISTFPCNDGIKSNNLFFPSSETTKTLSNLL